MKTIKEYQQEIHRIFEKRRDVYQIMKGMNSATAEFARLHKSIRSLDRQVTVNAVEITRLSRKTLLKERI